MVSIIMPVIIKTEYQVDFTKKCIESIILNTKDFELIIVKDKILIPGIYEWMENNGCKIIEFNRRFNFAEAINLGISHSKGNYILIMNNDTLVTERGWVEKMKQLLDEFGAVSAHVSDCSSGNPDLWERNFTFPFQETNMGLNMICLMMKRKTYDEVGQLDEQYTEYGGEDIDYSLRLKRTGYKLGIANTKIAHLKTKGWETSDIEYGNKIFWSKWHSPLKNGDLLIDLRKIKPIISILMPTYNHVKYIEEAIQSVLNQSFCNWELLIGNDGSTDETEKILQKYSNGVSIKVYNLRHQGFGRTMNFLLQKVMGKFICSFSSDDVLYPDSLMARLQWIDKEYNHKASGDIVYGTAVIHNEDLTKKGKTLGKEFDFETMLKEGNYISGDASLIKAEAFQKVGLFDPSVEGVLDYDWYMRAYKAGLSFRFMGRPILKYRKHGNNQSFGSKMANEHQNEVRRRYESNKS